MLIFDGLYFQTVSNVFTLFSVHVMVVMITSAAIYRNHSIFSLERGLGKTSVFFWPDHGQLSYILNSWPIIRYY